VEREVVRGVASSDDRGEGRFDRLLDDFFGVEGEEEGEDEAKDAMSGELLDMPP